VKKVYKVETIRAGQPRAYADHIYEYVITIYSESYTKDKTMAPWVMYGDVEASIKKDQELRAKGLMYGGTDPDKMRKNQRDWAKGLVRALCHEFREKNDEDGRKGLEAHFYPTLQSLVIDPTAGTIRVVIIDPFTD